MSSYLGKWGEEGFGGEGDGAAPDGPPRTSGVLDLVVPRSMPSRVQLVVIRQADGARVFVPRVTAPLLLLLRLRSLLPLPPFPLLLALRGGGIPARAAVGESFVLVAFPTPPSPGNHVARYYSSGPVNLQSNPKSFFFSSFFRRTNSITFMNLRFVDSSGIPVCFDRVRETGKESGKKLILALC